MTSVVKGIGREQSTNNIEQWQLEGSLEPTFSGFASEVLGCRNPARQVIRISKHHHLRTIPLVQTSVQLFY